MTLKRGHRRSLSPLVVAANHDVATARRASDSDGYRNHAGPTRSPCHPAVPTDPCPGVNVNFKCPTFVKLKCPTFVNFMPR